MGTEAGTLVGRILAARRVAQKDVWGWNHHHSSFFPHISGLDDSKAGLGCRIYTGLSPWLLTAC